MNAGCKNCVFCCKKEAEYRCRMAVLKTVQRVNPLDGVHEIKIGEDLCKRLNANLDCSKFKAPRTVFGRIIMWFRQIG